MDIIDATMPGLNSSSIKYGAATSLRENGEVNLNFKEHQNFFADDDYRVRIDTVSTNHICN